MIFLSGHVIRSEFGRSDFGFMITPDTGGTLPSGQLWAADSGCFRGAARFTPGRYLRFLKEHDASAALFATAPDAVGDAVRTLQLALHWLDGIRMMGYKAALVAQDGMEKVALPWDDFDALFIGGTKPWKLGPAPIDLCREAKERGKWLHWGAVNGEPRAKMAQRRRADSCDGTILAYGPDTNIKRVNKWLRRMNRQHSLLSYF